MESAAKMELRARVAWLREGGVSDLRGPTPLLTVGEGEGGAPTPHLSAFWIRPQVTALQSARLADDARVQELWGVALREAPRYGPSLHWLEPQLQGCAAESLDVFLSASSVAGRAPQDREADEPPQVTLQGRSLDLSMCLSMCLWLAEINPRVAYACSAECLASGELAPVRGLGVKARALAPCEGISVLIVAAQQQEEAQEALEGAGLSARVRAVGARSVAEALAVALGGAARAERLRAAPPLDQLSDEVCVELARHLSRLAFAPEVERKRFAAPQVAQLLEVVWGELGSAARSAARQRLSPLTLQALNEARLAYRRHTGEVERRWPELTRALFDVFQEARESHLRSLRSPAERLQRVSERLIYGGLTDDLACDQLASRLQSLTDQPLSHAALLGAEMAVALCDEVDRQLSATHLSATRPPPLNTGRVRLWGARARWRLAGGDFIGALSDAVEAIAGWEGLSQRLSQRLPQRLTRLEGGDPLAELSYPLSVAYRAVKNLEDHESYWALEALCEALESRGVSLGWYVSVERAGAQARLSGSVEGISRATLTLLEVVDTSAPGDLSKLSPPPPHISQLPPAELVGIAAARLTELFMDRWLSAEARARLFEALKARSPNLTHYLNLHAAYCEALCDGGAARLESPLETSPGSPLGSHIQSVAAIQRGLAGAPLTWRALTARCLYF